VITKLERMMRLTKINQGQRPECPECCQPSRLAGVEPIEGGERYIFECRYKGCSFHLDFIHEPDETERVYARIANYYGTPYVAMRDGVCYFGCDQSEVGSGLDGVETETVVTPHFYEAFVAEFIYEPGYHLSMRERAITRLDEEE
jgi:hypothetical protein